VLPGQLWDAHEAALVALGQPVVVQLGLGQAVEGCGLAGSIHYICELESAVG
jgi:hypothetical protein